MKIQDLLEDGRIVKGVNTTVDVDVNSISKEAGKFGNKVDKDGRPPTLSKKVKGASTNVLFNLGLTEGIILRLERDKHIDVLHVMDTKEKHRVEIRGKKGYESGNYDPQDKLHQVLDRVGKAANISELINGETVSINPNHPQGTRAIRTARDVLQTENKFTPMELALMEGGHEVPVKNAEKKISRIMEALTSNALIEALGELGPNTKIYVDMDGVLADFFGEWAKAMGKDSFRDIEDPANAIKKIKTVDDFWLNLPMLPQAKELLSLIKKVKGSYYICSSPLADDPRSEPHKREWVKKNLDFFLPKKVYITHNKPQFAKNNDGSPNILIDDYGVNINAWEEAGGIGFKYKDHKFERTAKAIKQAVGENFADGKKNEAVGPQMDPKAVEFEMLRDAEKRRLAGEYEKLGPEMAVTSWGVGLAQAVANYLGAQHLSALEQVLVKQGLKLATENFADGKKKGKSRPGRVKRAGASCNGSVTSLRKRAKNSSGEKARMYHWCANMKNGRKKKS